MLSFKFQDSDRDIELTLEKGEAVIVSGENGVGKTTLLRKIHHELKESHGYVEQSALDFFYDRKIKKIKEILLESSSEIDAVRFKELWKEFDLEKKEDRLLSHLSGGEAQALKLVAGLGTTQGIFLLDEPTHFLDQRRKDILKIYLQNLLGEKKTLLIVEHDIGWVPNDWRVLLMIESEGVIRVERK